MVDKLVDLLGNAAAAPQVRADALDALNKIQRRAERARTKNAQSGAHMKFLAKRIQAAIYDPEVYTSDNLTIPPGSPI